MTTTEFFMIALAAIFLWELYALIFVNRTIKVRGSVPYRGPVMIVVCVVFSIFYLFRWGATLLNIICCVVFLGVTLLFLLVRAGLTEHGVTNNGSVMSYSKINYYSVEQGTNDSNVRMRINSARRELVLLFPKEQQGLFEAYMVKNKVPTLEAYREAKKKKD